MNFSTDYKYFALEFLLRIFCAIIFLFQGYDKLFKVKIPGVIDAFHGDAEKKHVPSSLVHLMVYYSSIVEFFGGLLLILGFLKNIALILLGIDMVLVAVAFSFMNPVWDMKHVFPRLLLICILLAMPKHWEFFSIDELLRVFVLK